MEKTMLDALIELVRTGGSIGLWAIFLWQTLLLLKTTVVGIFVFLTIKYITLAMVDIHKNEYAGMKLDSFCQEMRDSIKEIKK